MSPRYSQYPDLSDDDSPSANLAQPLQPLSLPHLRPGSWSLVMTLTKTPMMSVTIYASVTTSPEHHHHNHRRCHHHRDHRAHAGDNDNDQVQHRHHLPDWQLDQPPLTTSFTQGQLSLNHLHLDLVAQQAGEVELLQDGEKFAGWGARAAETGELSPYFHHLLYYVVLYYVVSYYVVSYHFISGKGTRATESWGESHHINILRFWEKNFSNIRNIVRYLFYDLKT